MQRAFAIIPAVDVLDGRAVRLHQGDYDRIREAGDPFALIRTVAATSPPFVHVVALEAARDGGAPIELARHAVAAAAPVPVQLGGGVRSVADAEALVAAGVAIDVAGGIVRTAGWRESAQLTTGDALDRCTRAGVTRVVCTAIERDGTAAGPDLALLREVRARFAGSILAAGGVRNAADVDAVRATGVDGVVVGRALLDGSLDMSSAD